MAITAATMQSSVSPQSKHADGWQAILELSLQKINGKTCLLPKQRLGPLTVQRPFYPEGDVCHVYVLHPPGGVVGGDRLKLAVNARPGSHGLITTPGAGKFYRSAGKTAQLQQQFNVAEDAVLEFLPLESIYFPATELSSKISVNLQVTSKFVSWEIHCFGLPVNNEDFTDGNVLLNTEVTVDGKLLLHDKLKIDSFELGRTSGLRGNRVYGSFVVYSQMISDALLDTMQSLQVESGNAGVSCVEPSLLVARYLGDSTEHAQIYFRKLWQMLRPIALGLDACAPRIWNT
ncbi:MAG: urease accessory protein UreD [Arenicellales bacterium]